MLTPVCHKRDTLQTQVIDSMSISAYGECYAFQIDMARNSRVGRAVGTMIEESLIQYVVDCVN